MLTLNKELNQMVNNERANNMTDLCFYLWERFPENWRNIIEKELEPVNVVYIEGHRISVFYNSDRRSNTETFYICDCEEYGNKVNLYCRHGDLFLSLKDR